MKRFLLFIVFVLALAIFTINLKHITPAHSAQETRVDVYQEKKPVKSIVFAIGMNKYFVDCKTEGVTMDARPFIKEGRTFVPVRYMGNALGVTNDNITWNGDLNKAGLRLGGNSVDMIIGVARINVNGQDRDIDVAPVLNESEGRTYLPARYIAEGLGFEVDWDEASQTVLCWPRGEARPDVTAVMKYIETINKPVTPQNPATPPNLITTNKTGDKPEDVRQLEGLLGVTTGWYSPSWVYLPVWEKSTWDKAMWELANQNNSCSYFTLDYNSKGGFTIVAIKWIRNLSDIRGVELDLSPMEKVLNWRFSGHPDKVQEIMNYSWEVAKRARVSLSDRAPWKDYYIDGWKVSIGSIGGCFVEAIITKEGA